MSASDLKDIKVYIWAKASERKFVFNCSGINEAL